MLEYYKYFLTYFFMGFFGRPKAPEVELLVRDFEEIKVDAERRKTEAARIREELEKAQREADLLARVAAETTGLVGGILDEKPPQSESEFPEIQLHEDTRMVIPKGFNYTGAFAQVQRNGKKTILLSQITNEMFSQFGQRDIEIIGEDGEKITTQMDRIMNINGTKTTLRNFIRDSKKTGLEEMIS